MVYQYEILSRDQINGEVVKTFSKGLKEAQKLLEDGFDVNTRDKKGNTALLLAVQTGNVELITFLLEHGADVSIERPRNLDRYPRIFSINDYITSISFSKFKESVLCAYSQLMENGQIDQNSADAINTKKNGIKPLFNKNVELDANNRERFFPCFDKEEELFDFLLSQGFHSFTEDIKGFTPLHLALRQGNKEIYEQLTNNGATMNTEKYGNVVLFNAAAGGFRNILEELAERGIDLNQKDSIEQTPLHYAAANGCKEVIEFLINNGSDVNARDNDGRSPLELALNSKRIDNEVLDLLLRKGAFYKLEDGYLGENVLHLAVQRGNAEIVKLFLNLGININGQNEHGKTALHFAFKKRDEKLIELLLNLGAGINIKIPSKMLYTDSIEDTFSSYEIPALQCAITLEYERVVKLLLEKGASIHDKDDKGRTTLHAAASVGNESLVKLLLEAGLNVEDKCSNGETALYLAAFKGHVNAFKLLLSFRKGSVIEGNVLLGAAKGGHEELVKLILDSGVNANFYTGEKRENHNALGLAVEFGNRKTVDLLLSRGAIFRRPDKEYGRDNSYHFGLFRACESGNEDTVKYFCDVFEENLGNSYPVRYYFDAAICDGQEKVVRILLDYGFIDTEKLNFYELHGATYYEFRRLLFDPLEFEFEDRCKENKINKCFHITYSRITEQLLDHGALDSLLKGVDCEEDSEKAEAIEMSMRNSSKLQLLLDYNIDINLLNSSSGAVKIALKSTNNIFNAKLVTRHVVKMISANIFVSEMNLNEINNNGDLQRFKIECEKEIESMKQEESENPSIPFHKILISNDPKQLVAYARNKGILEGVSSLKYKAKFPIYSCLLHNQLKKGVWRKMLMDSLKGFFKAVAASEGNENVPNLPSECVAEVLSFLKNRDLRKLMYVGKVSLDVDICDLRIN